MAGYIGIDGTARKIKNAYIGVTNITTIYEGEAENDGSDEWYFGYGGAGLVNGKTYNVTINGQTYTDFTAYFYAEEGWHVTNGDITIRVETPMQGLDGSIYIYDHMEGMFSDQDSLSLRIYEGYENIARKVVKAYVGDENGKAKLVYSSRFEDYSWEQIIAACQSGSVPDNWKVGDTKPMTIGGTEYNVRIIGKNHDQYSDASGTAPLTFELAQCVGQYTMNGTYGSDAGYGASVMHTETLPSILAQMPSEVQVGIKPVTKGYSSKYSNGGDNSYSIATSLFLLSEMEVFGINEYAAQNYFDSQYEFYANGGSKDKDGATAWWLRDTFYNTGTNQIYCAVYNGARNYYVQTAKNGVSFAFCF